MLKFTIVSKASLFCFLVVLGSSIANAQPENINIQQLKQLLDDNVVLIDVRTPVEWEQTGIVPGSIAIMFFDEKGRANPRLWMQQAGQHISPDQAVAIICRSGNRSFTVGRYLMAQHGFQQVYNVEGGIKAWKKAGHSTIAPQ